MVNEETRADLTLVCMCSLPQVDVRKMFHRLHQLHQPRGTEDKRHRLLMFNASLQKNTLLVKQFLQPAYMTLKMLKLELKCINWQSNMVRSIQLT